MEHFAVHGYEGTRVQDIVRAAGVSKGAAFGYFNSKAGLFFAAFQAATRSFPTYLEAPAAVLERGFFATVTYWIEHTPHLVQTDWVPYRVTLLGNYCSDLQLKREITQWLARDDPYGTQAFVRFGIDRGEVRRDIDVKMVASLLSWLMDRCQDAIVVEELDPGLFGVNTASPEEWQARVGEFVELLRSAIRSR